MLRHRPPASPSPAPADLSSAFSYEQCDIPEGMTLTQWRCRQALADAETEPVRSPRRRLLAAFRRAA